MKPQSARTAPQPSDAELEAGLPEYAALLAARHAAHGDDLRRFLEQHWGGQNLDVLDVACGDGFYAAAFAALLSAGGTVTAVDLSDAFIAWAARNVADGRGPDPRVTFVRADAARLPFPDGRFDLIWCAQSLISLPDPIAALREMRRVARPGGTVAVLENDRFHEMQLPWPADLELALREAEKRTENPAHTGARPHAGRFLEEIMAEVGLTPTRRITLAIDRQAPLSTADEAFVQAYLHSLIRRTAGVLDPAAWDRLRRLSEPGSPGYLPAQPSFWMTWTDVVVLSAREEAIPA